MYSSLRCAGHPAYRVGPEQLGVEPHSEGFGKILIRVALRIPVIQMVHEALGVRLGRVVLRVGGVCGGPKRRRLVGRRRIWYTLSTA